MPRRGVGGRSVSKVRGVRVPGTWFTHVDYDAVFNTLVQHASSSYHAASLLIQLVNGARVSEAVEGFLKWCETGESEVAVRVRKKRGEEHRLLIVPVRYLDRRVCRQLDTRDAAKLANRVKVWAKQVLGINTHSLRYLGITRLYKAMGLGVFHITKHSSIRFVLHYLDRIEAEENFRKLLSHLV